MSRELPRPALGLSEDEAQRRYEALQKKLVPLWKSIQSFNKDEQTIVVVPSLSIEIDFPGPVLQAYEERFLFLLLLLRQPNARLVYLTSATIQPNIVDYYLHLLPGVIASHARKRLFLISPFDTSSRPLSLKLLERPRLIEQIRSLILDPDRAHLVPFLTTGYERDLALRLGIPMYGADPKYCPLGSKTGSRRIFAEEGVQHPLGFEDLWTAGDVVDAIIKMRSQKPSIRQVLVKLNDGVSGLGNTVVDLEDAPNPGDPEERAVVEDRLKAMRLEEEGATYNSYVKQLEAGGGIVEERIAGTDLQSPSAQLRVTPLGDVELLSTHDQVLGGPSGQSYQGCRFPADDAYAAIIMQEAEKVGNRLAKEGVIGRFAIDFVTVRSEDGMWEPYAIEINLRKGGTTHPFLTLQFLTNGTYDPETGIFTTALGRRKCFIASDYVKNPLYRAFSPDDLFNIVIQHGLHFDHASQKGIVLHMMNAVGEEGRFGMTAVGDTPREADELYEQAQAVFDREAERAIAS